MRATILYGAHKAVERLEWISKHVAARPGDHDTSEKLADEIDEVERFLLRVIRAQEH